MVVFPVSHLFLFGADNNGYNFTAITYSKQLLIVTANNMEQHESVLLGKVMRTFFEDGKPASQAIFPVLHCFVFRVDDYRCYFVIIICYHY